ncbi:pyrimidine-nucleoside phosphorylase, partial [Candidatus Bipolaricaulota bacterium]|nr:pyrimidine-nucleoside phosphorylase [Candidatus Bipolaricaulota bacterium]
AIDTLKGHGPQDLEDLCCALGAELVLFSGKIGDHSQVVEHLRGLLHDGSALEKFVQMVKNQGGDSAVVDDLELLPTASKQIEVSAPQSGIVANLDALSIGRAANLLGAGRFTKDDVIDPAVGIKVVCKVGEQVNKSEPLAVLHVNSEANLEQAKEMVAQAYKISDKEVRAPQLIVERVTGN